MGTRTRLAPVIAMAACLAAGAARAEWTADAEYCASGQDAEQVLAACTRALESGVLNREERKHTLNNRAWAHLEFDHALPARVDLQAAIALDDAGGRANAWNNLGRTYLVEENWAEAERHFLIALERLSAQGSENITDGPGTRVAVIFNLTLVYEGMGDTARAQSWVRRQYEIDPDQPDMQDFYRKYGLR